MRIIAILLLLFAALSPASAAVADAAGHCAQGMAMASAMPAAKSPAGPMSVTSCADCCTTVVQPVAALQKRMALPVRYQPGAVVVLTSVDCNLDPPLPRIAFVRTLGFTNS